MPVLQHRDDAGTAHLGVGFPPYESGWSRFSDCWLDGVALHARAVLVQEVAALNGLELLAVGLQVVLLQEFRSSLGVLILNGLPFPIQLTLNFRERLLLFANDDQRCCLCA